jgi:antitoxin component of RelBE/YafQ-DinJ toxin-antitoxin module
MPVNAKDLVERLKNEKRKKAKRNITLSLDAKVYDAAKAYLKKNDLMISELVEAFLKELLGKN